VQQTFYNQHQVNGLSPGQVVVNYIGSSSLSSGSAGSMPGHAQNLQPPGVAGAPVHRVPKRRRTEDEQAAAMLGNASSSSSSGFAQNLPMNSNNMATNTLNHHLMSLMQMFASQLGGSNGVQITPQEIQQLIEHVTSSQAKW
jgi:hypothetical protein